MLQDDGFPDASSVTVNKLDLPLLNASFARTGREEPAGRGGINVGGAVEMSQKDSHASTSLGGELQAPRLEARKFLRCRDHRGDTFAAQALGDRPCLIGE